MTIIDANEAMLRDYRRVRDLRAAKNALDAEEKRLLGQVRSAMEFMGVTDIQLSGKSLFQIVEAEREKFDKAAFDADHPGARDPYTEKVPETRFVVGRVHLDPADEHPARHAEVVDADEAAREAEAEAAAS